MPYTTFRHACRVFGALALVVALSDAGLAHAAASDAEHYVVVDTRGLAQYWRITMPPLRLPPRNVLEHHPSGCAAIGVRIEPDGTPHQVTVLKSEWTPMLPVYMKMLDARMIDQIRHAHFTPGPRNPVHAPVYSYIVTTFFTIPAFSRHPSDYTRMRVKQIGAKLRVLCRIPDFVARVARSTDTPLQAHGRE